MMRKDDINELAEYLRALSPNFFNERIVGASEEEINLLEEVARTRFTDIHREFLRVFGGTQSQELNPFLNDRDFCVETLLKAYAGHNEADEPLPDGIDYFSSTDESNIFLRHAEKLNMEPELGNLVPETNEFVKYDMFGSWLHGFAFTFRISQPVYQLALKPVWDKHLKRWLGEPEMLCKLLKQLDFKLIFTLEGDVNCLDRGDVAAIIYADGSGRLAGDNLGNLLEIHKLLNKHSQVSYFQPQEGERMYAARD